MDGEKLVELMGLLCRLYESDKRPVPELELIALAVSKGGSVDVDLVEWCAARNLPRGATDKRLRRLSRVGVHYDNGRVYLPSFLGIPTSVPPAREPARADAGPTASAAAGGCSLFLEHSSSSFSLNARVPRVVEILVPPKGKDQEEAMAQGAWLLDACGLTSYSDALIVNAAIACYSCFRKLGSYEVVRAVIRQMISKPKGKEWDGWDKYFAKSPLEYMTRQSFVQEAKDLPGFGGYSVSVIQNMDTQLRLEKTTQAPRKGSWSQKEYPRLRNTSTKQLQSELQKVMPADVWEAWAQNVEIENGSLVYFSDYAEEWLTDNWGPEIADIMERVANE